MLTVLKGQINFVGKIVTSIFWHTSQQIWDNSEQVWDEGQ